MAGAVSGLVVYMVHRDRRNSLWRGDEVGGTMMSIFLLIGILKLVLHVGRIFREEVKWRTLSDLMALPMPVAKIAGCVLTLISAVLFFLIGACLAWDDFVDAVDEMVDEPGVYLVVAMGVFFIHLVAYPLLWLKWGARGKCRNVGIRARQRSRSRCAGIVYPPSGHAIVGLTAHDRGPAHQPT